VIRPLVYLAIEEFQEGLRNRWVISAVLLLAILAFSLALLGTSPIGETRVGALNVTTVSLASLSVYLLPLIALTLSYDAVIGERERGTLILLLTYPISRWQVICGKFLGHFAIIAVAILLGYGTTGLYIAITDSAPAQDWLLFAAMMGSTLMLGSAFIALGYLISVTVSSRATAAGLAISTWLLVVVIYDLLLLGLVLSEAGALINSELFGALLLLNPADIYRLFNLAGSEAASLVSGSLGTMDSSFLSSGLLLGVLCLWIIVPIVISIRIFNRHEL
jgi:Cu-processing system permease protein